jgi:hypothetical protein
MKAEACLSKEVMAEIVRKAKESARRRAKQARKEIER